MCHIDNIHYPDFETKLGLFLPRICYFHPKNIGNLVPQFKLHRLPGKPASYFMGDYQQRLNP